MSAKLGHSQTVIEIPGYKIERTLGKGGMASVYLAIQESFEREVALKVMNPSLSEDPKFSERFLREAKIVSRLVHPNIVTVYDVGVHNQQHYLSMEYIPGQDLKHKRKQLRIRDSLQVVRDVAKALDYASKKGYVHRDVKPENIMLHEEDDRAVLMDFGIACLADTASGMTQTGTAIGTPHYMSPEQAKGRAVDSRSDIYSLGVVLFLLVTGHVPYDADSAVAVGIKHVSEAIPRLPKTLRALQPIIDKVMAKEPAARYQSGAELVASIDAIAPQELKAIELLTTRSVNSSTDGANTYTPTALSQAQAAVKATKNNPDQTTVAAAALHTRDNTKVPGQTGSSTAANKSISGGTVTSQARTPTGQPRNVAGKSGTQTAVKGGRQNSLTPTDGAVANKLKPKTEKISAVSNTQTAVGSTGDKDWPLYVDEEDRRDHRVEDTPKRRWSWLAAAAVIVAVAIGAVYFRAYLPEPVAGPLDQVAIKSTQLKNTLAASLGMSAPPPKPTAVPTTTPVAAPEPAAVVEKSSTPVAESEIAANASVEGPVLPGEASSLRERMKTDLSVAPQLAQLYRDTVAADPSMKSAEWGLRDVRDFHERNIRDALKTRDLETMQTFIASMEATFPGELNDDPVFQNLRGQLERAQRAQVHVDQADQYFADDALTQPAGANAAESYRQALRTDPGNPLAAAGLKNIVDRYVEMAEESAAAGRWEAVLQNARRGLEIDSQNVELISLQEESGRRMEHRSKVTNLLSAAQEQVSQGNLIEPAGESAYDRYHQLLEYDNGNDSARAGLREVEQQLGFNVESLINQNQFDQADRLIVRIGELFPGSDKVDSLSLELERAKEADFIARQPKIPELVISGSRPGGVTEQQSDPLNVDRTLHIVFSYANFVNDNSVVQAVLYDGSRTVQIAQVPVVVNGKDGEKFFQIDRPVEGFPAGGYNIDLILNDNKLRSAAFKVANQ